MKIYRNNTTCAPGRLIIPLRDLSKSDFGQAGPKAVNLGELLARGFPVPEGFVLTATAYRRFLEHGDIEGRIRGILETAGADTRSAAASVAELIAGGAMPAEVSEAVGAALSVLGRECAVAVRSSATAEDLRDASFAGLYETYLNVRGREAVLEHVLRCWASAWSERALAYLARAGFDPLESDVAVLAQVMVPAEFSGVLFTTNPISAHPGEIVVDAVCGLGENAVSGKTQPDHFALRKLTGDVKRRRLVGEEPCVSSASLRSLAEMGRRIEKEMGAPQDVEWAIAGGKVYLLQSRPITTLPPADEPVFTRKMGDQYWTDVLSPLTFSCGVSWIVEGAFRPLVTALGFRRLADLDFFRLHKSHLYFNTHFAHEVIGLFPQTARDQVINTLGSPHDDDYLAEAPHTRLKAGYAIIRGHLLDKNSGLARNARLLEQWSVSVKERVNRMLLVVGKKPPASKLMQMFDEVNRMGVEHFEVIRWGHASYNTALTDGFRDMCSRWADDADGSLFFKITGHVDSNVTLQSNQAMWETALEVRGDSGAREIVISCDPAESTRRILVENECPAARAALSRFLADYGHRTTSRDITAPHWLDAPEQVMAIIKSILSEETPESPAKKSEAARLRSERGMAEAISRLKRHWYGILLKPLFVYVAEQTRIFIGYRENQRATLDRVIYLMRRIALAMGDTLVDEGILGSSDGVFFLDRNELTRVFKKRNIGAELRRLIEQRRRQLDADREHLPPAFIKGSFEFDDPQEETPPKPGEYNGLGAAPGVIEGTARVLTDLAHAHTLRAGEILVTESTDPAWSAIFMKVSGLVLETGGILSHGAILAREFGLPAVTHVAGATRNISTGDRLRVDGTKGRVTIVGKL